MCAAWLILTRELVCGLAWTQGGCAVCDMSHTCIHTYGVATVSRINKNISLFCKRALLKRQYSAKETYYFIDPTHRSHPIRHDSFTHGTGVWSVWHDSFILWDVTDCYCVTELIRMCDMNIVWSGRDVLNVTQLIHMCDMTHSYIWRDSCVCATWLIFTSEQAYDLAWTPSKTGTGWRRLIRGLNLEVIFRKRATNYRALLRKMTNEDQASYDSMPPCTGCAMCDMTHSYVWHD